jgi:hypothetical protein
MSLTDWKFDAELDPQLDAAVFISPPSSLSLASPEYDNEFFAACLKENCRLVKEGRVDFQYRHSSPGDIVGGIAFRLPSVSDPYIYFPCYVIRDKDDMWGIQRWDGLDLMDLGEWAFETLHNTWRHMRASWWEEGGTLRARLEYESGGVWNLCDADIDTGENYNSGNTQQAVAIMVKAWEVSASKVWFDDVKIERLVSTI